MIYIMISIQLCLCFKCKMTKNGAYHQHDYAELAYILSGKGKYLVDGEEYDVEAGI